MPVQRGKKRRRPRHRPRASGDRVITQSSNSRAATPASSDRPARRRFELPLWLNVAFGLFLLAMAVFFPLTQKGFSRTEQLLILAGYLALAGLYLSKAFRQYRAR